MPYENGVLEAVAFDAEGKETGRDRLVSAEADTELRLEPEAGTVRKGHLAFVRLRLTDGNGITKVTERTKITLTAEGGKLLACGSACPYYEPDYLGNVCDTYYGEALAVIEVREDTVLRAESESGTAEIRICAV